MVAAAPVQTRGASLAYLVSTGIVAFALIAGGSAYLLRLPPVVEGVGALGYPVYLLSILGVWKLLGAAAILAPGFPRLKEWAYAGIVFNMTGAVVSHAAAGDAAGKMVAPALFAILAVVSWARRPADRRLPGDPL